MGFKIVDSETDNLFFKDEALFKVRYWICSNVNRNRDGYQELKYLECRISTRSIAEDVGITVIKIQRILEKMVKDNLITYTYKSKTKHKPSIIYANFLSIESDTVNDTVSDTVSDTVKHSNTNGSTRNSDTVNDTVSDTVSDTSSSKVSSKVSNKKDILSFKTTAHAKSRAKKEEIPYAEIVGYLNEVTASKFREGTPKTKTLIKARWNEGFRLDDFKKVIDIKHSQWNGTEWQQYLAPNTLFGTKFEGYLNQHVTSKPMPRVEYQEMECLF